MRHAGGIIRRHEIVLDAEILTGGEQYIVDFGIVSLCWLAGKMTHLFRRASEKPKAAYFSA